MGRWTTGSKSSREYVIAAEHIKAFASLFGDKNPVHFEPQAARAAGLERPIAHGAILNGMLSEFLGMAMPGPGCVVLSVDIKYSRPCYEGDQIRIDGEITHFSPSTSTFEIEAFFSNQAQRAQVVARAKVLARWLDPNDQ